LKDETFSLTVFCLFLFSHLAYNVAEEIQNEKKSLGGIRMISIPTTGEDF